jgi:hypothetical protein
MKRGLAAIAVAATLAAVGSIAYAAATGDGVIHACAAKNVGSLRLDSGKGCLPAEEPIQWNAAGPQGPQGIQGLQGVRGPAGVTHADERFFVRSLADPSTWLPLEVGTWPDVRPLMTHVLTLHLDPGNYAVTAEVIAANYTGVGVAVCLLGNPSVGSAIAQSSVGNQGGYGIQQTFQAQSVFPLPQGGDLELSCFSAPQGSDPVGNPLVGFADVIATQIDTFTSTQE